MSIELEKTQASQDLVDELIKRAKETEQAVEDEPTNPAITEIVQKFKDLRKEATEKGVDFFVITNLGGQTVLPIDLFPIVVCEPDEINAPPWAINWSFTSMQRARKAQQGGIVLADGTPAPTA